MVQVGAYGNDTDRPDCRLEEFGNCDAAAGPETLRMLLVLCGGKCIRSKSFASLPGRTAQRFGAKNPGLLRYGQLRRWMAL